jgi:hypothetical protein
MTRASADILTRKFYYPADQSVYFEREASIPVHTTMLIADSAREVRMKTSSQQNDSVIHRFDSLDYVGTDPMARDREQTHRLHEPDMMVTSIDPITGRDIEDLEGHPYIVDGNLVIYFESEKTRQEYLDTPAEHSVPLPDNPIDEGIDEG